MFGAEREARRPQTARMTFLPSGHFRRHASGDSLPAYDLLFGCTCCHRAPDYAVEFPDRERIIVRVKPAPEERAKKRGKKKSAEGSHERQRGNEGGASPSTATQPSIKEHSAASSPVVSHEASESSELPPSPSPPQLPPSRSPAEGTPRGTPPEAHSSSKARPSSAPQADKLVVQVESIKGALKIEGSRAQVLLLCGFVSDSLTEILNHSRNRSPSLSIAVDPKNSVQDVDLSFQHKFILPFDPLAVGVRLTLVVVQEMLETKGDRKTFTWKVNDVGTIVYPLLHIREPNEVPLAAMPVSINTNFADTCKAEMRVSFTTFASSEGPEIPEDKIDPFKPPPPPPGLKFVREEASHSASRPYCRGFFSLDSLESSLSLDLTKKDESSDVSFEEEQLHAGRRVPRLCLNSLSREKAGPGGESHGREEVGEESRVTGADAVVWRSDENVLVDARPLLRESSKLKCIIFTDGRVVHDWQREEAAADRLWKRLLNSETKNEQIADSQLAKVTLPDAPPPTSPVAPCPRRLASLATPGAKVSTPVAETNVRAKTVQLRRQSTLASDNDWSTPLYVQPVLSAVPICAAPNPSSGIFGSVSPGFLSSRQETPRLRFSPNAPPPKAPGISKKVLLNPLENKKENAQTSLSLSIQSAPRRRLATSAASLFAEVEAFKTQITSDMNSLIQEISENATRIQERLRRSQLHASGLKRN